MSIIDDKMKEHYNQLYFQLKKALGLIPEGAVAMGEIVGNKIQYRDCRDGKVKELEDILNIKPEELKPFDFNKEYLDELKKMGIPSHGTFNGGVLSGITENPPSPEGGTSKEDPFKEVWDNLNEKGLRYVPPVRDKIDELRSDVNEVINTLVEFSKDSIDRKKAMMLLESFLDYAEMAINKSHEDE